MTSVERIGLFGGSFSPIHNGHLAAIEQFRLKELAQRILLVPTGNSFYKDEDSTSFEDRLRMCRLAVDSMDHIEVSDIERHYPKGLYTFEMLQLMRAMYPHARFIFLVGSDVFIRICCWKNISAVAQMTDFAVIAREPNALQRQCAELLATAGFLQGFGAKTVFLEGVRTLSSTEVRRAIEQGRSIESMVPDGVGDYIVEHRLYGCRIGCKSSRFSRLKSCI